MKVKRSSLPETVEWGKQLGSLLEPGDVVGLIGPLGVGKTTLVKGIAEGAGTDPGYRVTSPTFVFAHIYKGRVPIYHLDLYRVENDKVLQGIGLEEMIGGDGIGLIEWFDLYPQIWREDRLEIRLAFHGDTGRELEIVGFGERPGKLVRQFEDMA